MSKISSTFEPEEIVSKMRRFVDSNYLTSTIGIVLNDDGSVFDRQTKKKFNNVIEWSRKCRDEL